MMLSETCIAWRAYFESHNGGDMFDKPGDLENHIRRISLLLYGAVDLEKANTVNKQLRRRRTAL